MAGPKWHTARRRDERVHRPRNHGRRPRIGVVATTAFLIAAQFGLATAIDRYGWFGVEQVGVTWPRLLGIGLLVVGAALTLRR